MAMTEPYTGTATVTSTELDLPSNTTVLSSVTDDGIYQLYLDLSALASGDRYQVAIYEKVTSGGTRRLVQSVDLTGPLSEPVYVTPSLLLMHGWTMTAKKLQGTDRSVSWSIRKVA